MNLIERRRRGLGSSAETYTFVNYIESHRAEYINTGYVPSYKARFVADATLNSYGALFGTREYEDSHSTFIAISNISSSADYLTLYYHGTSQNASSIKRIGIRKTYDLNRNKYYENGGLQYTFTESTINYNNSTIIFGRWNSRDDVGDGYFINAKLYNFKLYDNDVLVRDMRPAIRDSDGEVGLLDIVNNVFYTNQGTGAFTYG